MSCNPASSHPLGASLQNTLISPVGDCKSDEGAGLERELLSLKEQKRQLKERISGLKTKSYELHQPRPKPKPLGEGSTCEQQDDDCAERLTGYIQLLKKRDATSSALATALEEKSTIETRINKISQKKLVQERDALAEMFFALSQKTPPEPEKRTEE